MCPFTAALPLLRYMAPRQNKIKQYEQGVKTGVILVYYNAHVPQRHGFSSTLAVSAKYQHLAQFSGDRIWMKIRIVGPLVAIPVQAHSELLTSKFGFLHQQSSGQQSLSSLNLESHTYAKATTKDGKKPYRLI